MKRLTITSLITLTVGLALVVVAAVFDSIVWGTGFNGANLVAPLNSVGYLTAAFSGIVLTAVAVASAVRGHESGK